VEAEGGTLDAVKGYTDITWLPQLLGWQLRAAMAPNGDHSDSSVLGKEGEEESE
jgi:hypothetical protein